MINFYENLPKILKKKKTFKNVLIIGGGPWSRLYLHVLLNSFFEVKKIIIYSKNNFNFIKKIIIKKKLSKKVKLFKNFQSIKKEDFTHAVIVNKTSKHFLFFKKILNGNCNLLIEKPITYTLKEQEKLFLICKKNKKNFLVGFQRFYTYYFHYFKKKILKKKSIKSIDFYWFDEGKKNVLDKIYLENIFYHIASILFIFFGKKKINFLLKQKSILKIKYGNIVVNIHYRFNNYKKVRVINFNYHNYSRIVFDWRSDSKIFYSKDNKKKSIKFNFPQSNLQYQLYYFLNTNRKNLDTLPNSFNNLSFFFDFLKKIK